MIVVNSVVVVIVVVVVVVVLLVDVCVVVSVTHWAVDLRAGAVSNGGRWRGSAGGRGTTSLQYCIIVKIGTYFVGSDKSTKSHVIFTFICVSKSKCSLLIFHV